jgi:hypothetical protein
VRVEVAEQEPRPGRRLDARPLKRCGAGPQLGEDCCAPPEHVARGCGAKVHGREAAQHDALLEHVALPTPPWHRSGRFDATSGRGERAQTSQPSVLEPPGVRRLQPSVGFSDGNVEGRGGSRGHQHSRRGAPRGARRQGKAREDAPPHAALPGEGIARLRGSWASLGGLWGLSLGVLSARLGPSLGWSVPHGGPTNAREYARPSTPLARSSSRNIMQPVGSRHGGGRSVRQG